MSQCEKILCELKKGPITTLQAIHEFKILRLAARIHNLRERGHHIVTTEHETLNAEGKKIHYAEYHYYR